MSNGGIIGKLNPSTFAIASGVWSLREQQVQRLNSTWPSPAIYVNDGTTLSGWTTVNATVNNSLGNPAPSLQALGGQYAHYNVGTSLLGKTIEMDMFVLSGSFALGNIFFACNSSGSGQLFRLDCRGSGTGFTSSSSWTSWGTPSGPGFTANTWYNIKIVISSGGVALSYVNNSLVNVGYTIANNGNYIAIHGDSGVVSGSRFDNIKIYNS